MFKTIISKKRSTLFNFNLLNKFNENQNILCFSHRLFARREINKNYYLNNLNNLLITKNSFLSDESKFVEKNHEINLKSFFNKIFSDSRKNINSSKQHPQIKKLNIDNNFLNNILKSLEKENIDLDYIENSLKLIDSKYPSDSVDKSISFRFLVLLDQILSPKSIEEYKNNYNLSFLSNGFGHFYEIFNQNYLEILKNEDTLLTYNFLYFMTINKGDFSDILLKLSSMSNNFRNKLKTILNKKIKLNNNLDELNFDSIMIEYENNIKTAPSEITNDYSFKYRSREAKIKLYNQLILKKQNIQKMKFLIGSYNKNNKHMNYLEDLERNISLFLLKDVKEIFDNDFLKIKDELNILDKLLAEILISITDLKIFDYNSITLNNIDQIYNPIFSGETDLKKQFRRVTNNIGYSQADEILKIYFENISKKETIFMKDIFNLNKILINGKYNSVKDVLVNILIDNELNYKLLIENYNNFSNKNKITLTTQENQIFEQIKNSIKNLVKVEQKTFTFDEKKPIEKVTKTFNLEFDSEEYYEDNVNTEYNKFSQKIIKEEAYKKFEILSKKDDKRKPRDFLEIKTQDASISSKKVNLKTEKIEEINKISSLETKKEVKQKEIKVETQKEDIYLEIKEESKKEDIPLDIKLEAKKEDIPLEIKVELKKEDIPLNINVEIKKEENPLEIKEESKKEDIPLDIKLEAKKEDIPLEIKNETKKEEKQKETKVETIKQDIPLNIKIVTKKEEKEINKEAIKEYIPLKIQEEIKKEDIPLDIKVETKKPNIPLEIKIEAKTLDIPLEIILEAKKMDIPLEIKDENINISESPFTKIHGIPNTAETKNEDKNLKTKDNMILETGNESEKKNNLIEEIQKESLNIENNEIKSYTSKNLDVKDKIIQKESYDENLVETKKTEFTSMEEKFKKQKMKKFYFNDKKDYSTINKFTNKNFSSKNKNEVDDNEYIDDTEEYNKFDKKKSISEIKKPFGIPIEKLKTMKTEKINFEEKFSEGKKPFGISLEKLKTMKQATEKNNLDENTFDKKKESFYNKEYQTIDRSDKLKEFQKLREEKIDANKKTSNYLEEITKKNVFKGQKFSKIKEYFGASKTTKIFKPQMLQDKTKEEDQEEINILTLLENDDKITNSLLDFSNNSEIVVEINNEISEFGFNYWLKLIDTLKNEKNVSEKLEDHMVNFFKYLIFLNSLEKI